MRIEERIEIDAATDRVWRLIEDPAALTGLDDGLSIEADPETPNGGLRARYRVLWRVGPVPIGTDVEIVELTPGRELAWTSLTGLDHRFRFRLASSMEAAHGSSCVSATTRPARSAYWQTSSRMVGPARRCDGCSPL